MIVRYASCRAATAEGGKRTPLTMTTCSAAAAGNAQANTRTAKTDFNSERMTSRLQLRGYVSIPRIWEVSYGPLLQERLTWGDHARDDRRRLGGRQRSAR